MILDYRRYVSGSGIAHRPVGTVKIIGPRGVVRWDALVDTGSDITLLPSVIADDLGIDLAAAELSTIRGVGDQPVDVRDSGVELEITDGAQSFRWDAEVSFLVVDEGESHFALLGHQGGLSYFVATFDGVARTMELTPISDFPGLISDLT